MQNISVKAGTVDVSCVIRIVDSGDGTPETGVTSATGGLALEYRRELAASVALTESDLAALTTAHADGGMKHIGNGYYRVDLPDAACATGAAGVMVHGVATGMVVVGCYINLTPVPADVMKNAGHALVFGTLSGTHSSTTADLGTNAPANDISGQMLFFPDDNLSRHIDSYDTGTGIATFSPSVAVTLTNGDNWVLFPSAPASTGNPPPVSLPDGAIDAGTITAAAVAKIQAGLVVASGTIGSTGNDTTHLHLTGQPFGDDELNDLLLVVRDVSASEYHARWVSDWVASTALATLATLPFTPENAVDTYLVLAARQDARTALDTRIPAALVGGRIDATVDATGMEAGAVATILTTQMTEAYAADGAAPTLAQALMMIQQMLGEFSVSGTTLTLKKLDGSTSAATFTLSDAADPTSITRAS